MTSPPQAASPVDVEISQIPNSYRLRRVVVSVPEDLSVSEGNSYYPQADIVWRGDPFGNRHAQIKAVAQAGFDRGAALSEGDVPIDLAVEVRRFHALTERTRYTIGGLHEFSFLLTFLDASTGLPLAEPYHVDYSFKGFGGEAAVRAEQAGQTQKVRIIDHLAQFTLAQLALGPVR